MTTKDWIYLGLMALTALAFYCNGFYAGVLRSRKVYENLLRNTESEEDPAPDAAGNEFADGENFPWHRRDIRDSESEVSRRTPGGFQNN